MAWYYAEAEQQKGPVDDASLDELVRQGVVRDDTLIWKEGMPNWQPHSSVRGARPMPPPIGSSAESRYCSECGRSFPASELYMMGTASVCAGCRPAVAQRMPAATPYSAPVYSRGAARHYGGFWMRFVARIIDGIIIGVASSIIRLPLTMAGIGRIGLGRITGPEDVFNNIPFLVSLAGVSFFINIALALCYEVYFLSSRGATPGKMAVGLKVIRADGGPVSTGLAAGRFFASWISGPFTLCIGYIIAGFDLEKRSLHDRICETRVIYGK
jgi:uncharacterized RDD family membrane protein YckC